MHTLMILRMCSTCIPFVVHYEKKLDQCQYKRLRILTFAWWAYDSESGFILSSCEMAGMQSSTTILSTVDISTENTL